MCNDSIYEDALSHQPDTMRLGMSYTQAQECLLISVARALSSSYRPQSQTRFGSSHQQSTGPVYYRLPHPVKSNHTRPAKFESSQEKPVNNPIPIPEMAEWELPVVKQAMLRERRPDRVAALLARNFLILLSLIFLYSFTSPWLPEAIQKTLYWICFSMCAFFTVNIGMCTYVLFKPRDQCFDLPLSPRQRQLLGLLPTPMLTDDEPVGVEVHPATSKPPLYSRNENNTALDVRPSLFPRLAPSAKQIAEPKAKAMAVLQLQRDLFAKHFSLNLDVEP